MLQILALYLSVNINFKHVFFFWCLKTDVAEAYEIMVHDYTGFFKAWIKFTVLV